MHACICIWMEKNSRIQLNIGIASLGDFFSATIVSPELRRQRGNEEKKVQF